MKTALDDRLPPPRTVAMQLSPEYAALKAAVWAQVEVEARRHARRVAIAARNLT